MKNFLIFFLLIAIETKALNYNHKKGENNLYFVFTTFINGARESFRNKDYFGNKISSPGALTKFGLQQNLDIGKNYRERYSNFIDINNFNKEQIYVRCSNIERIIQSAQKQLEGFFNQNISSDNIDIIKGGLNFINLYNLDNNQQQDDIQKYKQFCNKIQLRKLYEDYESIFQSDIFPILKSIYSLKRPPTIHSFCDSANSAYFDYTYGNNNDNKISKCGEENIKIIYNFCKNWYNSYRGWDEYGAYIFYKFYNHILENMDESIKGTRKTKMIIIGGEEMTLDKFIGFLNGMKIVSEDDYPNFGFNIVIELRKYTHDYYLEIYYNDILKYNNTLEAFRNILDNSKYSNLYNYCGIPPWEKKGEEENVNNTNDDEKIEGIKNKALNKGRVEISPINNKNQTIFNIEDTSLKGKIKKLFKPENRKKLCLIIGCIILVIVLILIVVFLIIYKKNKKSKLEFEKSINSSSVYKINSSSIYKINKTNGTEPSIRIDK